MKSLFPPMLAILVVTALCFGYTHSLIGSNLSTMDENSQLQFELSKLESKLPDVEGTGHLDLMVRQEMSALQRVRHIQVKQLPVLRRVAPMVDSLSWDSQGITLKASHPQEVWQVLEGTQSVTSVRSEGSTLEATWSP